LNVSVHGTIRAMRRRQLDLRAAAAVLAEGELTMSEVAERLGVAKPTLYKLAGSKDELIRACVDAEAERVVGHLHEHLAGASTAWVREALRAMAAYADDSPGGFRLLFERRGPDVQEALRRLEARLADLLRRNAAAHPDLLAAALLGAAAAVVSRAHADGRVVDAEALAASL
jgi:AcrR family transcriptional regulator